MNSSSKITELLQKLYAMGKSRGIKPGLDRIKKANDLLGNPLDSFETIHVGGTNGKGSVSTKIAAAFQEKGVQTALFTSPHIASFRERMRVNGKMITQEEVLEASSKIDEVSSRHGLELSFFEYTTLLAFLHFSRHAELAVMEVGLGGRLDATNLIVPKLAVITSISLDHEHILGKELDKIAEEKGGIIKKGVPIVLGPTALEQHILSKIAEARGAPILKVKGSFDSYEAENRAIAKCALKHLEVPEICIQKGLEAIPPCRFEVVEKEVPVVFDVAHNPAGVYALIARLKTHFPSRNFRFILAFSADKNHEGIASSFAKFPASIHLTQAKHRACHPSLLLDYFPEAVVDEDVKSACLKAYKLAVERQEVLVVTGTFYIMADCKEALGISVERDELSLSDF